jgi:hypothetical protein
MKSIADVFMVAAYTIIGAVILGVGGAFVGCFLFYAISFASKDTLFPGLGLVLGGATGFCGGVIGSSGFLVGGTGSG